MKKIRAFQSSNTKFFNRRKIFAIVQKNHFPRHLEKFFDTWKNYCNVRLEGTDFSLINYSQEKDLNNLDAARKDQKNPEKV